MSVYQSNISKHKIDLNQTQYKDIDKRYFDQLIQLKVDLFLIGWVFSLDGYIPPDISLNV